MTDDIYKFVTLTLSPKHWECHIFWEWAKIKDYCDSNLRLFCKYYKLCPEIQKNGHIHCHLLIHFDMHKHYINLFHKFISNYKYGYSQYNTPRNYLAADRYISKICDDMSEQLGYSLPDEWQSVKEQFNQSSCPQASGISEDEYQLSRNKICTMNHSPPDRSNKLSVLANA